MKTAWYGFEANALQNDGALSVLPVTKPIIIRGFIADLSLSYFVEPPPTAIGPFSGPAAPYSIAMFQWIVSDSAAFSINGDDAFGAHTFKSETNKESADHYAANAAAGSNVLLSSCLNLSPDNKDPVNKTVVVGGLDIAVPAGKFLVANIAENGVMANFQAQLTLVYDDVPPVPPLTVHA